MRPLAGILAAAALAAAVGVAACGGGKSASSSPSAGASAHGSPNPTASKSGAAGSGSGASGNSGGTSASGGAGASGASAREPLAKPMSDRAVAHFMKDFDKPEDPPGDPAMGGRDGDDNTILARFGHPTTVAESRRIAGAVLSYLAVARSGDGRKACTMLLPSILKGIAIDFGQFGYSYARHAKTCPEVTSLIFKHLHHRLSGRMAAMDVIVNGEHAYVLVGSTTMPAAFVTLQRWHGAWRLNEPIVGDMY